MGKVVMYGSVPVDGSIADDTDQPGPLFDWLTSGDVPLDETGALKVSQTPYDHTRAYWDRIGLVDEVRMDVVPVVLGSGKRYFGPVDARHLLEDPEVLQGNRVLHLRYQVRR
ncbi:hypothetical protein [Actinokineospora terrae]|uniref:RibD C-terminal domain-containing protein n=1 Tax=Actinokineospora terrae TaxID=155974 RepID=A0A1H9MGH0_9PSEU|nr:hypothetical protein [Actinokineospora terrae]SER22567.1 hypothetical protein SAMN04487818_102140 [Actinokineospora terrae]